VLAVNEHATGGLGRRVGLGRDAASGSAVEVGAWGGVCPGNSVAPIEFMGEVARFAQADLAHSMK
jgi:hypothetical protein